MIELLMQFARIEIDRAVRILPLRELRPALNLGSCRDIGQQAAKIFSFLLPAASSTNATILEQDVMNCAEMEIALPLVGEAVALGRDDMFDRNPRPGAMPTDRLALRVLEIEALAGQNSPPKKLRKIGVYC
ncbi:hypothetical protein OEG86_17995 [Hoeflea alexandrii]|uniref:hypothetical protein n=1 Tax=Hoeflea alexandrii TaxID=288436 RepID=UPI00226EF7AC|nr:hypothetical protein [Hoeflea alexandrii]MCY0153802.1 hypothetical protein [Hoeflea alexandrii]